MMQANSRWLFFWCNVLILLSASLMIGRMWSMGRSITVDGKEVSSPLLSANDRSRWLTIRSLAETGGYAVEQYTKLPGWNSIDKVVHHDRNGNLHQYSSKPPLLATMLAPIYIANRAIFGWNLTTHWFASVRALLIVSQVIPFLITLWFFSKTLIEVSTRNSDEDRPSFSSIGFWGILLIVGTACLGTYLSTFIITLNNHLFAALGVFWTLLAVAKIRYLGKVKHFWFAVGGAAAAFAAANELPALSFLVASCFLFLLLNWRLFFSGTLPAVGIVAFAFFGTNLVAHDSLRPPYTHRKDGEIVAEVDPAVFGSDITDSWLSQETVQKLDSALPDDFSSRIVYPSSLHSSKFPLEKGVQQRWVIRSFPVSGNFFEYRSLALCKLEGSEKLVLKKWDNWYDYPGSYWFDGVRKGVDKGEPDRWRYAFHCFVGHHGIFSLSPIWIVALIGIGIGLFGTSDERWVSASILLISTVVIGFYLMRPQLDRNYGGVSCGLRWTFWLAPMWLVAMIPAARRIDRSKVMLIVAAVLLLLSIVSANYAWSNPWIHPWPYELFQF